MRQPSGNDGFVRVEQELLLLGLNVSGHPLDLFNPGPGVVEARDLPRHAGRRVTVAGWAAMSRRAMTKNGKMMFFLTLEDRTGLVETTFFPEAYHRLAPRLRGYGPFRVTGRVDNQGGAHLLIAEEVEAVTDENRPHEGGGPRALEVSRRLLERGWIVLTGGPTGDTLTLTPPLDVDEALLDAFAGTLADVLS